jgi:hypothetical protein
MRNFLNKKVGYWMRLGLRLLNFFFGSFAGNVVFDEKGVFFIDRFDNDGFLALCELFRKGGDFYVGGEIVGGFME